MKFQRNVIVLLDQAVVSGGNFLLGILLTRFLGLEQYGIYALLWMVVLAALSFNQSFITQPLLSIGPQYDTEKKEKYINHLHVVQISFALVAALITAVVLWFGNWFEIVLPSSDLLFVLPAVVGTHLLYDFYRKVNFLNEQMRKAFWMDATLYTIMLGGVSFLAFRQMISVSYSLWMILFGQVVITLLGFVSLIDFSIKRDILNKVFTKHWSYSKWLVGTSLLQWFSGNFFIIAGASVLGAFAVGVIRMVQNVMGLTHILFLAMENVVPVKAAQQLKDSGVGAMKKYLSQVAKLAGGVVGSILLGIAIFAPFILSVIYGAEHSQHSGVVVAFCGIYIFVFIGYPLRIALRTLSVTRPIFVAYIAATIFSGLAAYPMLNGMGMNGLILGLLVTQLITVGIYTMYLRNTITALSKNEALAKKESVVSATEQV